MKLAVFECKLTCLLFIDGCRVGMLVVCGLSDHQPRYCYLKIRENNVTSHVHKWLFCYSWQFTVLCTVALVMPMSLSSDQMLDILQTACVHSSGVKFHFSQVDGRERPQHFTSPHAVARPTHASVARRPVSCIGPMCYLGHNTSTYKTINDADKVIRQHTYTEFFNTQVAGFFTKYKTNSIHQIWLSCQTTTTTQCSCQLS